MNAETSIRAGMPVAAASRSGPKRALLARIRRHGALSLGIALIALVSVAGLLAPWLGTVDPVSVSPLNRIKPPSAAHWFGTDGLGRDLYSRVVYGARVSLVVGFGVASLSAVCGLAIGVVTGFSRWFDAVAMRVMDGMMAIPPILLAIALVALTRASIHNVIIAITIAEVPRVVRLVRGVVLTLREQPFVEASISSGSRVPQLIWRHILPNTMAPLMVQATYIFGAAMLLEATLSFLGAGTPPAVPSWGNIIAEGRSVFQIFPWAIVFPGIFLSIAVLAVNLIGDGLRDALDPRLSRLL